MIPILYNSDETRFVTNGLGRLSDCTRCIVTEERNGIYECEFDYPITGIHFDEIKFGRIVGCTHDDVHDIQPFIIYSREISDLSGVITFRAHHISYKLNEIVTMPFTAGSIVDAFSKIKANSVNTNPFTFWTDKTTTGDFKCEVPKAIRGMLGGEEGSILDVYGAGDYKFDRYDVKLYAHRGVDSDVEIRYSKNLTDLQEDIDAGSMYNAVVPYWMDSEGNVVTLPEKILVYSGVEPMLAYLTDHNLIIIRTETEEPIEVPYWEINAVPMDMSSDFEAPPTPEQLRDAARRKFENSDAWLPVENLTIDFVQLWQTEEFKDYAAMQRVSLCDTVSVYYPAVGIRKVKQRVIKVVYNVLLDRYDSIELGAVQNSLGQTIRQELMREVPTTSMMEDAIAYATDMIRGGLGGYVVMTPGPNGYPQEILIMDTPDINTAVNVWRFNQGGLGHSHNGYLGPFNDIALTQDGKINATMITTGEMVANRVRAGLLQDETGDNYWDLTAGRLVTTRGKIGPYNISATGLVGMTTANSMVSLADAVWFVGRGTWTADPSNYLLFGTTIYRASIFLYTAPDGEYTTANYKISLSLITTTNSGNEVFGFRVRDVSADESIALFYLHQITLNSYVYVANRRPVTVTGDLSVWGTKSRRVTTKNYSDRLLYCYETPTPLFGDIGEAVIDEDGYAYVDIDDIFTETIADKVEYQVFLQKEGEGDCWVADKTPRYFVVKGTAGLKFAWELKAKQRDYEMHRLEPSETGLDEYVNRPVDDNSMEDYITKQEELLYG